MYLQKDSDAGKDGRQEEKGMTEDEMIGWCYWLSGLEFEQALVDGEGQGSLACCGPWRHRVRHDWVNNNHTLIIESQCVSFHSLWCMRFLYVIVCGCSSHIPKMIPSYKYIATYYLFCTWWMFGTSPVFGSYEECCGHMQILKKDLCEVSHQKNKPNSM